MNAAKRAEIFRRLCAANPAPTTELEYATTFQLLVAVILSAQATDKSVNLATRKLFADAPTPQAMLALGEAGLAEYIKRIGLFSTKARNVTATWANRPSLSIRTSSASPTGRSWRPAKHRLPSNSNC